jgi:hypothetical protein
VRLTGNVATGNDTLKAYGGGGDLVDGNPAPPCANIWRGNRFDTKAGDGVACIR